MVYNKRIAKRIRDLVNTWQLRLEDEFYKPYMVNLSKALIKIRKEPYITVCPRDPNNTFNSFKYCSAYDLKVVIVTDEIFPQYYASGLGFFQTEELTMESPNELNFKKLIKNYRGSNEKVTFENIKSIANQGVLFLNTTLTTDFKQHTGNKRHVNIGWEQFCLNVIKIINTRYPPKEVLFVLVGENTHEFSDIINHHPVLKIKYNLSNDKILETTNMLTLINKELKTLKKQQIKW